MGPPSKHIPRLEDACANETSSLPCGGTSDGGGWEGSSCSREGVVAVGVACGSRETSLSVPSVDSVVPSLGCLGDG